MGYWEEENWTDYWPTRNRAQRRNAPVREKSGYRRRAKGEAAKRPRLESEVVAFAKGLGITPDPMQAEFLQATEQRLILCCTRQWGKSTVAAIKALHAALTCGERNIVIASKTLRQALRLLAKVRRFARLANATVQYDRSEDPTLVFENGSVVRAIPNAPDGERSLDAVHYLVMDEAAFTPDQLFHALYPMLATTDGAIWLLSTPNGREGFFYEAWHDSAEPWRRFHATAPECPRITKKFLDKARRDNPEPVFRREYMAEFVENSAGFFLPETITSVVESPPIDEPVELSNKKEPYYAGLDVGQRQDHSALAIIRRVVLKSQTQRNAETYEWLTTERLEVMHLQRYDLHAQYSTMAYWVRLDLERQQQPKRIPVAVDRSGGGEALYSIVEKEAEKRARLYPVTITSGERQTTSRYGYNVPRKDLLTGLAAELESGNLVFSAQLGPEVRAQLQGEMRALRADFKCRSGKHDDLAIALALAVWISKKGRR